MVRCYHWSNGQESEQTTGDSEGQEACCAAVHGIAKSPDYIISSTMCYVWQYLREQNLNVIIPAFSNSCPLSRWYHPAISSFVIPVTSRLQSGSFSVNQSFTSRGQSIGAWASSPILPMNIQGWVPLGLTCLISLQFQELSRVFSDTTVQKHQFFGAQLFFIVQNSHLYMITGKNIALTRQTFFFFCKVITL